MSAPKLWFQYQNYVGDFKYREATPDEIRAAYAALEPDEPPKYTWRDVKAGDRLTRADGEQYIREHDGIREFPDGYARTILIERGGYGAWRTVKPGETK